MSGLPVALPSELEPTFVGALDPSGKLVAALDALGPVANREVLVVGATGGPILRRLADVGARLTTVPLSSPLQLPVDDATADVVLGLWSAFRGVAPGDLAEVDRALRPGGRHLIVHDYGRDDVSRLFDDRPEYGDWSHRSGPFLAGGFRVRVVHCFWEFETSSGLEAFLAAAFGERGASVASGLRRPRLSYNVAVYHRSRS